MDETLREAYRNTVYLVCVDAVQWPQIRLAETLPAALQVLVDDYPWGFITAWNPRSVQRSVAANTAAQGDLLAAVRAQPGLVNWHAGIGIGIGASGWYEPSLFVIGPGQGMLDDLCNAHAQNAYVCGRGHGAAQLRVLRG